MGAALLVTAGSLTIAFVLKPHHTPSGSMLPTVAAGEWFWVYNWAYRSAPVQRGELVVITSPKDPDADYLKRVLAVAGDHLMVKGQFVEVNGKPLRAAGASGEPFEYTDASGGSAATISALKFNEQIDQVSYQVLQNLTPMFNGELNVVVPADQIYVFGDNRDNSLDSRFWGAVPVSSVQGRVVAGFSNGRR